VLTRREHVGPLRVQKALYPEGEAVCHALLVHPPAGIVGGDRLALDLDLGAGSHALVTTPGATKWYGSAGPRAVQDTVVRVGSGACLEWLPQENIVYDGAEARQTLQVDLQAEAAFLGLDILCLGRRASGEHFRRGRFGLSTRIDQGGVPLWREWGTLHGGSAFLDHPAGLQGAPVSATVLAAGVRDSAVLVAALRAAVPAGEWAVTALPGLVLARWLGQAGEAARLWFTALWQVLRPALCGRLATLPRIWHT
jgi:urease accessory protein